MYISTYEPNEKATRFRKFNYTTGIEKNKLFVRNIPLNATEEDLTELFRRHGSLREVRLVRYRNGHSKGLAYVEYEDERSASTALLNMDGYQMKGGTTSLSIEISNPPKRKETEERSFLNVDSTKQRNNEDFRKMFLK
ncbi:hypothetical protein ACOME3_005575 [Neoechinorhynchus agilis]